MPLESPASVLYDDNGIALAVSGGVAIPLSSSALLFAGATPAGTASIAKMEPDGTIWVTGSVSTFVTFPATQSVNIIGPVTASVSGSSVLTRESPNYTAVVTSTAVTTIATTLLSASTNRYGVIIYNNASKSLFLRFGTAPASNTDFTVRLSSNSYYEVPAWYNGAITGIWDGNSAGGALITVVSP